MRLRSRAPGGGRFRPTGGAVAGLASLVVAAAVVASVGVTASPQAEVSNQASPQGPAAEPKALDEARAMARARKEKKRVEATALTSPTGKVYANPTGTFTLEQHTVPVRVKRGDRWVGIDTTLKRRTDGTVSPEASVLPITLSGGGDKHALVKLARDGKSVALTWPGTLPSPTLKGDTATYPDVFPGVDLQITAGVENFTKLFVVKDRAAATRLSTLTFGVKANGVTVKADKAGVLRAVDAKGKALFTAATPLMWDSPGGKADGATTPGRKRAAMPVKLAGGKLSITPDQKLFAAPDTKYPVYVDPAWTGGQFAWTMVEGRNWPNQSYWNYGREQGAKVGYVYDSYQGVYVLYRSLFKMDTAPVNGKNILRATFAVTNRYSYSCNARGVQLWLNGGIDAGTTWNNAWWGRQVDQRDYAYGYNGNCGARRVEFDATNAVQEAAGGGWSNTVFGLKAANEGDQYGWKRFDGDAIITIEYNSYPNAAYNLRSEPNMPCVTGDNRPIISTRTPTLRANVSDPDGQNLFGRFEWWHTGGAIINHHQTGWVPNGGEVSVRVYDNALADGVYSWRVLADDGTNTGPWSGWCEFQVDTTRPNAAPTVTAPDLPPNGDCCLPAGKPVTLTFGANGESGIGAFLYGFDKNNLSRATAGADGTARVPITVWKDAPHDLYVYSEDKAGNRSVNVATRNFIVSRPTKQPAKKKGDVNGDGFADLPGVSDLGYGETGFWNTFSTGYNGGFFAATVAQSTGQNSGWTMDRIKTARGDFTGDGLTDLAVFRDEGNARMTLWIYPSHGSGYCTINKPIWDSGPGNWFLSSGTPNVGDFNGDGKDDLIQLYNYGGTNFNQWVFLSTSSGLGSGIPGPNCQISPTYDPANVTFASPTVWHESGADPDTTTYKVGDFNADGKDEVAHFHDLGNCRTTVWSTLSTGSTFGPYKQQFDSGDWNWCAGSGRWEAGDATGDGRDELINLHIYPDGSYRLWTMVAKDDGVNFQGPAVWWEQAGSWADINRLKLSVGDFNGDGKEDVAHFYDHPAAGWQTRVHDSMGSGFVSTGAEADRVNTVAGLPNGTVLWASDLKKLYKVAGNAALPLESCMTGLCGGHIRATHWQPISTASKVPADGTFLQAREAHNETLYKMVGGEADRYAECPAAAECSSAVQVNQSSIEPLANAVSNHGPGFGQLGRYVNGDGEHFTTTGTVWAGYRFQQPLGQLIRTNEPNTTMLYACQQTNGETFSSVVADCENNTKIADLGYLYRTAPAGIATLPLYRCLTAAGGEHFDSNDETCEGKVVEGKLGYTMAYASLIWYGTNSLAGVPWEGRTTTLAPPTRYQPLWQLGLLSLVEQPGTRATYTCMDGNDEFLSVQADCEGKTKVARIGYLWEQMPAGVPGTAIYRCIGSNGDRYSSHHCDGVTEDALLGYVYGRAPLVSAKRGNDQRASNGVVEAGYYHDKPLGFISFVNEPGTRALYSCKAFGYDEFISHDSKCEGQKVLRPIGWIWSAQPAGLPTTALYRCVVNGSGEHFASTDSTCEGQKVEWKMGYILTRP